MLRMLFQRRHFAMRDESSGQHEAFCYVSLEERDSGGSSAADDSGAG
jgi:hypothetical protein